MNRSTKNYLKIALASTLWGTLGFFGTTLRSLGLSAEMIAISRLASGLVILLTYFAIKNPSVLRIDAKGFFRCALSGIVSQGIFNLSYFTSMRIVGAFTSAVLLYASIVFMFILGTVLYKERPTFKKTAAATICLIGCVFGATGGDFSTLNATAFGVFMGLLAAFTYSLMPILNRRLSLNYNPFTIIIYSFLGAMIFLIPFAKPQIWLAQPHDWKIFAFILLFGFIVSVIPYGLYIPSLDGIQISRVGVISSVELIITIAISGWVLKERILFGHFLGMALIISSILVMNLTDINLPAIRERMFPPRSRRR